MLSNPYPDAVCGACRSFEPSRNDAYYGFCKLAAELDRERGLHVGARLLDINHPCFLRHADWYSGKPAFSPKATPPAPLVRGEE